MKSIRIKSFKFLILKDLDKDSLHDLFRMKVDSIPLKGFLLSGLMVFFILSS